MDSSRLLLAGSCAPPLWMSPALNTRSERVADMRPSTLGGGGHYGQRVVVSFLESLLFYPFTASTTVTSRSGSSVSPIMTSKLNGGLEDGHQQVQLHPPPSSRNKPIRLKNHSAGIESYDNLHRAADPVRIQTLRPNQDLIKLAPFFFGWV